MFRFKRSVLPCGVFPFALERRNNRFFAAKLRDMGLSPQDVAVVHVSTLSCAHYAAWLKRTNPATAAFVQLHLSYAFSLRSGRLGVLPLHATFLYRYYRRIVESVDGLIFISKMSRDTFGKRYVGSPEGKIEDVRRQLLFGRFMRPVRQPRAFVVYNGIDRCVFNPGVRPPHKGFVVGCAANFDPLKSQMTLLEAAAILKDDIPGLKVRFVGSGPELEKCRRYAARNGLDGVVSFEKEVPHGDMPEFYRSLDLFAMPSRLEGFCCVCAESQACGAPAMFCENTALAELVPDAEKDKWIFPPMDARALAERILAYCANRWTQHFTADLEIRALWKAFLDNFDCMRRRGGFCVEKE